MNGTLERRVEKLEGLERGKRVGDLVFAVEGRPGFEAQIAAAREAGAHLIVVRRAVRRR